MNSRIRWLRIVRKKLVARSVIPGSDPLGTKTVYYRLTPAGAKLLGAEGDLAAARTSSTSKALGILDFAAVENRPDSAYTRQEFWMTSGAYKGSAREDYHTDFFIDFDGEQARFGQIVVDLGGEYKKLISKCRVKLGSTSMFLTSEIFVSEGCYFRDCRRRKRRRPRRFD